MLKTWQCSNFLLDRPSPILKIFEPFFEFFWYPKTFSSFEGISTSFLMFKRQRDYVTFPTTNNAYNISFLIFQNMYAHRVGFVVATTHLARIQLRRKGKNEQGKVATLNELEFDVFIHPIYSVLGI